MIRSRLIVLLLFVLVQVAGPVRLFGGGVGGESGAACGCCALAPDGDSGCGGCCGGGEGRPLPETDGECACGDLPVSAPALALAGGGGGEIEEHIVARAGMVAMPGVGVFADNGGSGWARGKRELRDSLGHDPPSQVHIEFTRVYRL